MKKWLVLAALLILVLSPTPLERTTQPVGWFGAWMPWILIGALVIAAGSLAALSLLGTERAVCVLRWWPAVPLGLLLLSVAFSPGAGVVLLFVLPGYSIWCGIGALQALAIRPQPDLAAVFINGSIALVACIPFVLIEMGLARFHI